MIPSIEQITPVTRSISVFFDEVYQYDIQTEYQLNNLRIFALATQTTDKFKFVWIDRDIELTMTKDGDLSRYPSGLFSVEQHQMAQIIRLKQIRTLRLNDLDSLFIK